MKNNIEITKYSDLDNFLTINNRDKELAIDSDNTGDIELCMSNGCCSIHLYLNQKELKQLIEFLQTKITE